MTATTTVRTPYLVVHAGADLIQPLKIADRCDRCAGVRRRHRQCHQRH
jgi:hypothetical protein